MLRPGGRLIVSVNHPFRENLWHREAGLEPDYFATYNYTVEWTAGGQSAVLRFWTRPLHAMADAFTAAGFRITVISEPAAAPDTPSELLPADIAEGRRSCASCFSSCTPANRQARSWPWCLGTFAPLLGGAMTPAAGCASSRFGESVE